MVLATFPGNRDELRHAAWCGFTVSIAVCSIDRGYLFAPAVLDK